MDHELRSYDLSRTLKLALPLLAIVCIAGLALSASAALKDNETLPNPQQYYDWDTAYVVDTLELGSILEIRKDGGGDWDFLKLPFLAVNDMVTVDVHQTEKTTTVEYWVSDPYKMPIYYYYYTGPPAAEDFSFQFAAIINGPYYIHTGQGFGETYINMTINRQAMSPSGAKDNNNKPSDRVLLSSGSKHTENAGMPWDPSEYFYINVQPTLTVNKYLTIEITTEAGTSIQWEMYDSNGIQRPSDTYSSDTIRFGSGTLKEFRVMVPGDYIIRIWMMDGYGSYDLTLTTLSYPNDQDNSIAEATLVTDNTHRTGDVNLSFDRDDYMEIYLTMGEPLWVHLNVTNGPADLYIFDVDENQRDQSRRDGLTDEWIKPFAPLEDGYYYIVVEAVYESPDWEFPPTVDYVIDIWINYGPERKSSIPSQLRNYHIDEDTPDADYNVTLLFEDKDGDDLVYELDMSYNNTLIDIQLLGTNFLSITPMENMSGFKVPIVFNATDPHGLMVNYTATIHVDPVNDGPFVDFDDLPDDVIMGEDLVKSGVNVTKAFRDIDDDYLTWTFVVTTTTHIKVEIDEDTWLATFTPLVKDWFGEETFTVTCTDKGDLNASYDILIDMYERNDPPIILNYINELVIDEEDSTTIDLLDPPYFEDPEGKSLTYGFDNNGSVSIFFDGAKVIFQGQKDATGIVSGVLLWAIDDLGAVSTNITILITLVDVNDPPILENLMSTATVKEGEGVILDEENYYFFEDIDSTKFELLWEWLVDGEIVPAEQIGHLYAFEYIPPVTSEGDRTVIVTLRISEVGATETIEWTINVQNKNQAPTEPQVTADKTVIKEDESITFSANATDLDNDQLTYRWFLDELEEVGTGVTLTLKDVDPGDHKVTVEVTDPSGESSTQDFEFKVNKKSGGGDSPGFGSALVVAAMAIMVVALVARRRR